VHKHALLWVASDTLDCSSRLMFQQKMQGRFFAGRRVEAFLYAGKERYNRTVSGGDHSDMEVDGDEKKRLDDFADWLMNEED
jgi:HIV Tat-specific factor 1